MNKIVRAHGPQHAKIAVVTDYPENPELVKGEVLGGYSNYLMEQIFEGAGYNYKNVYYTSLIKEQIATPPKEQKNKLKFIEKNRNIKADKDLLIDELRLIKPNVIVTLGEIALEIVTKQTNTRKVAGSILRAHPNAGISLFTKVIPILHPRDIRKEYSKIFPTIVYVKRAVKYSTIEDFPQQDWHIRVIRNATELGDYFNRNANSDLKVVDVETFLGLITAVGFCCDGVEGISVPMLDDKIQDIEHALMYNQIRDFLANGEFVNQNIGFDEGQLNRFNFKIGKIVGDTMLMTGVLYPELDKNLGFLNSLYTEIPYFKDEGKDFNPKTNDTLYEYNAKDCIATHRIWQEQSKEAREEKMWDFYQRGPAKFYYMYQKMEQRGIRVDEEARTKLRDKYEEKQLIATYSVEAILGSNGFNPQSNPQCCNLLYNELKLPVQKKRRANGQMTPTADAEALENLALNYVHDSSIRQLLLNLILIRKLDKILQYINSIAHDDGRMRYRYKIAGTESGRTSTSQCDDYWWYRETPKGKMQKTKLGFSIQQFPKHGYELIDSDEVIGDDLRLMFIPSPGYQFIDQDQKQAEAVVVGTLGRDNDMLHVIDTGDLHTWTAALVLNKLQTEVTKRERQVQGKKTRHGGHYDETFKTLSIQAKISQAEAKVALIKFHQVSPNIRGVFQNEIKDAINKTRCLVTPHGRKRDFFGRLDANTMREGYSYIPQAVISDNQKFGMLRIQELAPDIRYLMEAHDGSLAEIPIGTADKHFEIIKDVMEQPIKFEEGTFKRDPVIIRCEFGISDNSWGEMRDIIV